ncbi:MAG: hypothetical protein FVQ81_15815 [Candidatus Glassbacteria bacterium]|nr:hypothetical protein [Candidatus Glassbacteria bacterium]
MRILTSKLSTVLFINLVLIFALGVATLPAQQKIKVSGKHTLAYTKQDTINVGDTEGHILSLSEFEGTTVSTGKNKFMDGARDVGMGFSDLVMGNGSGQGYLKSSLNGVVVFSKHQLKTATTLSPEGKPVTTFEGSFTWTKGTGKYENIQGGGTFKGKFISRIIFIVEWEGEYFIEK